MSASSYPRATALAAARRRSSRDCPPPRITCIIGCCIASSLHLSAALSPPLPALMTSQLATQTANQRKLRAAVDVPIRPTF